MNLMEIVTKEDLTQLQQTMLAALSKLVEPQLEKLNDYYMTVEEIAAFTQHDKRTVRAWITEGKLDRFGGKVRLVAEEFCPGKYRALKSEVIRYGKVKELMKSSAQKRTA